MKEKSLEELLDLAIKKYPIGTEFISVRNKQTYTVKTNSHRVLANGIDIDYVPWLFLNGDWAEIISKPKTMFKKGDYIVYLSSHHTDYFRTNWIFKQLESNTHLFTETSVMGCSASSGDVNFTNCMDWRYATENEIECYKSLGHPFDVSKIMLKPSEKDEKMDWVECYYSRDNGMFTAKKKYLAFIHTDKTLSLKDNTDRLRHIPQKSSDFGFTTTFDRQRVYHDLVGSTDKDFLDAMGMSIGWGNILCETGVNDNHKILMNNPIESIDVNCVISRQDDKYIMGFDPCKSKIKPMRLLSLFKPPKPKTEPIKKQKPLKLLKINKLITKIK